MWKVSKRTEEKFGEVGVKVVHINDANDGVETCSGDAEVTQSGCEDTDANDDMSAPVRTSTSKSTVGD